VSLELLISTLALVFQVIVIFSWLAVLLSYFIYRAQTPPIDLELGTATTPPEVPTNPFSYTKHLLVVFEVVEVQYVQH